MNIVITGGAGFIGSNAAAYYLGRKANVTVVDNLSRQNSEKNLAWLTALGGSLSVITGDIRAKETMEKLIPYIQTADLILHLAAQVAVTTSVLKPVRDFEINAFGTLQVLEAMRQTGSRAKLIYASTNKVYGEMAGTKIRESATRYEYANLRHGVSEQQPLDFHSPYGCSKGAADQYVYDYARVYGLDTTIMRQSCIYGPRQFGVEDQGWLAWFVIASVLKRPITIYGDGKQVRDVLYIDDLIRAFDSAYRYRSKTRGKIYNIGGGPEHTVSVWREFGPVLERLTGNAMHVSRASWRPGDQKIYVSDIRKAQEDFGWKPRVALIDGVSTLYSWVLSNRALFI